MEPLKLSRPFFVVGNFGKVVDACAGLSAVGGGGSGGLGSKETSLLPENRRPTGDAVENELDRCG